MSSAWHLYTPNIELKHYQRAATTFPQISIFKKIAMDRSFFYGASRSFKASTDIEMSVEAAKIGLLFIAKVERKGMEVPTQDKIDLLILAAAYNDENKLAEARKIAVSPIDIVRIEITYITMDSFVGRFAEAKKRGLELLQRISTLPNNIAVLEELAVCFARLGFCCREMGKLEEAKQWYIRAMQNGRKYENIYGEAYGINGLGIVEREMGNINKARSHLQEAADLFQKLGNWPFLQDARHGLNLITLLEADLPKAKNKILEELVTSEELGLYMNQISYYFNLLQIALLTNNSKMFAKYSRKIKNNKSFGGLCEAKMYIHEAVEILHTRLRSNYSDRIEALVNNKLKAFSRAKKEQEILHGLIENFINEEQPLPEISEKIEKASNIFIESGAPAEISEQDNAEGDVEEQVVETASLTNSIVDENETSKGREKVTKNIVSLKIFFKRIVKRMYWMYKYNKKNIEGELPDINSAEYALVSICILHRILQDEKSTKPALRNSMASV